MARGETILAAYFLLLGLSVLVDADSLLPTYYDDDEEQARYGVVSLSPSTTSLNYTLNLSGLLMLGLSVAAATMFWAHVTALSDNKIKRSLDDDEEFLDKMQRRFESGAIEETICQQRIVCEIAAGRDKFMSDKSFGYAVNVYFSLADENKAVNHKRAETYLTAWNEGKRGNNNKVCETLYGKCPVTNDVMQQFIGSE